MRGSPKLFCSRFAPAHPLIGLPQQQLARVAREPVVAKSDLNCAIEFRLKSRRLAFTRRVNLPECVVNTFNPEIARWFSFLKTF
jgi:hypothetical protein